MLGWHCSWCFPVEVRFLFPANCVGLSLTLRSQEFVTKLESALSGDGTRWGDYADKKTLSYLRANKNDGRWFDGSVGGTLHSPADEVDMAPPWAIANRARFEYLFDRAQ